MQQITLSESLYLESGASISNVTIGYHLFGKLNKDKSNVVWVFHALTGNSDPTEWWPGIVGEGCVIDPKKHFIICANMLGSCYGSTEPTDFEFPLISIKDQVQCFQLLCKHLNISQIKVGIGGSMGGQQLLEWAVQEPTLFDTIIPIATNAKHSPWSIAFNETQRMAIKNDPINGITTARAIAMLSYRHYDTYQNTQLDQDTRLDKFSASSYQNYQGRKLQKRFSTYSYYYLSKAMDSQNVGRHFASMEKALKRIKSEAIVIGINSDVLFPISEQEYLSDNIPNARFHKLESIYGHDGFLVETSAISQILSDVLSL